jgi:hypothetical protein
LHKWNIMLVCKSVQSSPQFSYNLVVLNASEGSPFFQIFNISQVHYGSCKKLPYISFQCCYIFLVLKDFFIAACKVLKIEYCSRAWGMLSLFIIPHVKTQSKGACKFPCSFVVLLRRDYPFEITIVTCMIKLDI